MSVGVTLDGELMFPSRFVGAIDLRGRDAPVEISDVKVEDLQIVGGKKVRKVVLYFVGKEKALVTNKTNSITIAELHGSEMKGWIGKRIILFPTTAMLKGKRVPAVRVRDHVPQSASAPSSPTSEQPQGAAEGTG